MKPGEYNLTLVGDNTTLARKVKIQPGKFKNSYITVQSTKEEMVRPQKRETKERRKHDNQLIAEARRSSSQKRLWQGEFNWPVESKSITTSFGATRYVNGKLESRHSGLDIAAPEGSNIKASASGIIKLATNLLVTGNTIIIDHGWNVSSSYSHLKSIYVKPGQKVKKGDVIGIVGSTGFSTGAHLHWTIKVNGVFVNPEQFLEDDFTK